MKDLQFSDFTGNTNVLTFIKRMLVNNTFPQFTIFNGTMGTGKSSVGKLVATTLTCESYEYEPGKFGYDPCCICPSCRNNMKALTETGQSMNVKIVNLGKMNNKLEIKDLIKDIFVLKAGDGNVVYVLEEAHALKYIPGAQTALLEEIDRMPKGVYIIMCTTREYDLIPELCSRATVFNFKTLSLNESLALIDRELCNSDQATINLIHPSRYLIARYSKGIPRNILKSIEFIRSASVSYEEYLEFIDDIQDGTFIEIFASAKSTEMKTFLDLTSDLSRQREPSVIYTRLVQFVTNAFYALEGVKTTGLTEENIEGIKEVFTTESLNRMVKVLHTVDKSISAEEMDFLWFQLRLAAQGRTKADVVAEVSRVASTVAKSTTVPANDYNNTKRSAAEKISLATMTQFSKG